MFRQNNDDDDDDESYVYFMEGEVVVHRQRRTNPSAENEASSTEEVSTTATTTTPHPNPQAATDERVGLDISENYNSNQPEYSDESGGLQAILEVRLTPRHRNAEPRQNRSTALPTFPELPSH